MLGRSEGMTRTGIGNLTYEGDGGFHQIVVCDDVQDPMTLDPQKQFTEKNHTTINADQLTLVKYDAATQQWAPAS